MQDGAPGVVLTARFDEGALLELDAPINLPERLSKAVLKRRAEFMAGRLLAYLAQEQMGRVPSDIGISEARAPLWPSGINGSISHSSGYASVWLCAGDGLIGHDLEAIASGKALAAIEKSVLTEIECSLLMHEPRAMTAAFSAKETLYKALYRAVGRFFGFGAAHVTNYSGDKLTLTLTDDLTQSFQSGQQFVVDIEDAAPGVRTRLFVPPPL